MYELVEELLCLDENKSFARSCALDAGNMLVLCIFVVSSVGLIFLFSKGLVCLINKHRKSKL